MSGKRYTEEFKVEAVKQITERGHLAKEVAERLGITSNSIYNWLKIDGDGAREIARRSRGTPRIANRLLRRVRDYAEVKGNGQINHAMADKALAMIEVDAMGFDRMDRQLLRTIIEKFGGGPVGLDTLSAALNEEKDTIEDVLEPYLLQEGFIKRTPRGRVAGAVAYKHLGITVPSGQSEIF